MTPGARVQAAIEVLDDIRAGAPAERAMTTWARRSRFAGSKDRAAIRDHVFQALRCLRSYACLGGGGSGRQIMIGALRASGMNIGDLFSGAGHAPAVLTEVEARAGHPPRSDGEIMDLQDWIVPLVINSLGGEDNARNTAYLLKERAPVMLRVNTRKASIERAVTLLANHEVTACSVPAASTSLTVTDGARRIASSGAYRDGIVELQDGSSQAAMEMIEIAPGARVLDLCAGGGGKILAVAARVDAQCFAHDIAPQRMKDLPQRAKRAGVSVTLLDRDDLQGETFDLILCDAPCSGSGTWRRNPDAKWRLTPTDLQNLNETQDQILSQAAQLTGKAGRIVYATCSVLACENEDRVAHFLARNSEWDLAVQRKWPVSDMGDGFFAAQLRAK